MHPFAAIPLAVKSQLLNKLTVLAAVRHSVSAAVVALVGCGFSAPCIAQTTCETAQQVSLGTVPFATAPSFSDHGPTTGSCGGSMVHHAVYFRFTAAVTGWYSACAISPAGSNLQWNPSMSVLDGCGGSEDAARWTGGAYFPASGQGCGGGLRTYATSVFRMEAGQSRVIIVGGSTALDFGQGDLRLDYVGITQMDGAQPLQVGANVYTVAAFSPALRSGGCDIMPNAQRFSFTPSESGTYRLSFCDRSWPYWRAARDADFQTLMDGGVNCNIGRRFTGSLKAGQTYYFAPGTQWNSEGCSTGSALVEFVEGGGGTGCETAQQVSLGTVPFATVPSFPDHGPTTGSCGGSMVHHAVYFRFTAAVTGWYSACAISPAGSNLQWHPSMSVLDGCGGSEDAARWTGGAYFPASGQGCGGGLRTYATSVFRMEAGQSRVIIVGGSTAIDFGQGDLRLDYIGITQMDGAQPLQVGANVYTVAAFSPALRSGGCDIMPNAQRFSFTPSESGTYRLSFCDRSWPYWRAARDADFQTLMDGGVNCNIGREFTGSLEAGQTYYFAPGTQWNSEGCATGSASVWRIEPCPPDLNDDGRVDGIDMGMLLVGWGTAVSDVTGDGTTDGADLSLLLAMWGGCPAP